MAQSTLGAASAITCPICQAGPMLFSTTNQHLELLLCVECGAALSVPRQRPSGVRVGPPANVSA